MKQTVLAIIPARGGSKGIPRKNLALCGGRSLIDWVCRAALDSQRVTHPVVSSDDFDILNHARELGVMGLPRPPEFAADESTTESVMHHAIEAVGRTDLIVLLQPTSPLTTGQDIDAAISLLEMTGVDSVVSVVPTHVLLWQGPTPSYDPALRPRRQEMAQMEENGAIYVTTREQWERTGCRFGGKVALHLMDEEHRFQVDSPADLELCSWLLEKRLVPA